MVRIRGEKKSNGNSIDHQTYSQITKRLELIRIVFKMSNDIQSLFGYTDI